MSGLANCAWIFLWHYEQFPLTLIAMLVLLAALIVTYLRLGIGRTIVPAAETWAVRLPFSIYLGWITVATMANVTTVLDYLKWNGFGIAPEIWMVIMVAAVLVITVLMIFTRRDVSLRDGYPLGAGGDIVQACWGFSGCHPDLDHLWPGCAQSGSNFLPTQARAKVRICNMIRGQVNLPLF